MDVTIERGRPEQRETLAQLIQLYVHDFSDFWDDAHRVNLDEDGRFPPFPHLDTYWTEPDRAVYFIRVDGALAGFALINAHAFSGLRVDCNLGEYFVARRYRRQGIGARALASLLAARPGQWELAVWSRNAPALAFWPRALARASVDNLETLTHSSWDGPIFRFVTR